MSLHDAALGIRTLCPRKEISQQEWCEILTARQELLKPHLPGFNLLKLEDVPFMNMGSSANRTLKQQAYFLEGVSDVRGIFGIGSGIEHINAKERIYAIWGFTRNAMWIIVRVKVHQDSLFDHEWFDSVSMENTSIQSLIADHGIKPRHIASEISGAIHRWRTNRERLFNAAVHIDTIVTVEDCLTQFRNSEGACFLPLSVIPVE